MSFLPLVSPSLFHLPQIWMRCFTPVDAKHRSKLWGGLAPPPLHRSSHELDTGRWHRQLVCGLVTLFAQVWRCGGVTPRLTVSSCTSSCWLAVLRWFDFWRGTALCCHAGAAHLVEMVPGEGGSLLLFFVASCLTPYSGVPHAVAQCSLTLTQSFLASISRV